MTIEEALAATPDDMNRLRDKALRLRPDPFVDVDGVGWRDARTPSRWHRCRMQSSGRLLGLLIERCACGGIRWPEHGRRWSWRNAKLKAGR